MLTFGFAPEIEKGIAEGIYKVMVGKDGLPRSIAQWATGPNRGDIAAHAIGFVSSNGIAPDPVVASMQFAMRAGQMYQTHRGFQAVQAGLQTIQASLSVLQTMTALTGVGVAANLAISAVSLWQILKLREDVKLQRLGMREGLLNLEHVLRDQGKEIIQKLDAAIQDIEFRNHRQALAQAYGKFLEATRLMKIAMSCEDLQIRNADLANARQTLTEALADYKNPHLLPDASALTQLRRSECVWALEQTIAVTYQLQNQPEALSHCLEQLQDRVCQDVLTVIDLCDSQEELDIIFPEITRIHEQDLVVLKLWQEQVNWVRSLPPSEQTSMPAMDVSQPEITETPVTEALAVPSEQLRYETLKQKSHFSALRDALQLMMQSEMRRDYETYIHQQAGKLGRKVLTGAMLQQMSNLSVANLYWYFQVRDESEQALTEATMM